MVCACVVLLFGSSVCVLCVLFNYVSVCCAWSLCDVVWCVCFMVLVCVLHGFVCFVCDVLRDAVWIACLC